MERIRRELGEKGGGIECSTETSKEGHLVAPKKQLREEKRGGGGRRTDQGSYQNQRGRFQKEIRGKSLKNRIHA